MLRLALFSPPYHRQFELACGATVAVRRRSGRRPGWELTESQDFLESSDAAVDAEPELIVRAVGTADRPRLEIQEVSNDRDGRSHMTTEILDAPACVRLGDAWLVAREARGVTADRRLPRPVSDHAHHSLDPDVPVTSSESTWFHYPPSQRTLHEWFHSLGLLQRTVAGSNEFFQQAATMVCHPGGFDAALVLVRANSAPDELTADGDDECSIGQFPASEWRIAASCAARPPIGLVFDPELVRHAELSRGTIYHRASPRMEVESSGRAGSDDGSRPNRELSTGTNVVDPREDVVVCPLIGVDSSVVGMLYAVRAVHEENQRRGVRPLEIDWVRLVAETIGHGLARMESEVEAARHRVLLRQLVSPTLADRLAREPELLAGRQQEITVLLVDLRNSSHILDTAGPLEACGHLGEVLEMLSDCVLQCDGTIVDYFGDGLMAMWNAPTEQSDHARLAVRAALEMQRRAASWPRDHAQRSPVELAIGIHTGEAMVGNVGSQRRLKYGPRGAAVHLASRLEALSKQLGGGIVVSGATRDRLGDAFSLGPSISVRPLPAADLPGFQPSPPVFQLMDVNAPVPATC